jgi:ribosome-associated protein
MDRIIIPFSELTFSFSRSGGAGGQNVNKVNSKVTLTWDPATTTACSQDVIVRFRERFGPSILDNGLVQIVGQKHRSQKANMDDCIAKLHEMLNEVRRPPKVRKKTKPKRSAMLKRLDSKKRESEKKRLRRGDY